MNFYLGARCLLIILLGVGFVNSLFAQCPDGDEVTFGTNQWQGYVYDGVGTFDASDYQGEITLATIFNETFCVDNCNFLTDAGCPVDAETFSIRFKNQQTLACGRYTFTVGSDYGVRFSLNGGATYLIDVPSSGSYQTYSIDVSVSGGTYDMVIEYSHNTGVNQVEFDYSVVLNDYAGEVSGDQTICASSIDPSEFTSLTPAMFCSGEAPQYQWQESSDNINFFSIPGAFGETYDVSSGLTTGTYYYRRSATDGTITLTSNVITVTGEVSGGDENFYPTGTWRGYVYEGGQNYSSADYQGYFDILTNEFNTDFCGGDACLLPLDGCDIVAEDFSVRLRSEQDFACGAYLITIGGNDGVRLFVDGVQVTDYVTTYSEIFFLNGTHQFVIEYYDVDGANQISFETTLTGTENGGLIAGDQTICASPIDPDAFTNVQGAGFCSGVATYQWQNSADNSNWFDIPGATLETYDIPAGAPAGTTYYRRQATDGITTLSSNVVTVIGDSPMGDQNTFGVENWIGYIYDGADNFTTNYRGFYAQNNAVLSPGVEGFDQDFGGDAVTFPINGCDFVTEDFSVRYMSTQDFNADCGAWNISIGGDDGVRLYVDGVLEIDGYSVHTYQTFQKTIYLDGVHEFILEYYDTTPENRVSFSKTKIDDGVGGEIDSDQISCSVDPDVIGSIAVAESCLGTITYQWETSADGNNWSDIPGANGITYDPPVSSSGLYYYRRGADDGTNTFYSNEMTIDVDPILGDQTTPGDDSWIGYVYVGADNFASDDYRGYITETFEFDEAFCGGSCRTPINGCDIITDDFSIRFLNTQSFTCGAYQITIGADDGVRLTIDGVNEDYFFDEGYSSHSYQTYSYTVYLSGGDYSLTLDYFDDLFANQVSFRSDFLGLLYAGEIGGGVYSCESSLDPPQLASIASAEFCSGGTISYQWQESYDSQGWTDIGGADAIVYDPPLLTSTRYYRRRASSSSTTAYSNIVGVILDPPLGDETTYGSNSWIGYVYEGADGTFNTNNYQGFISEPTEFDESFCGGVTTCTFPINGCDVVTDNFSVRFRNRQFFACGLYELTIGGDDGVRLSIDGVEYIDDFTNHSYQTSSVNVFLDGTYDLELDYYDNTLYNRVSFSATLLSSGSGGTISADQSSCQSGIFNPNPFVSVEDASFCSGTVSYQWEESTDDINWSDIPSATFASYDETGVSAPGTYYYRRRSTNGTIISYSNTVTVTVIEPSGDPDVFGVDEWIGYVYDGVANFDQSNYLGFFTRPAIFDEEFCNPVASICSFPLSECDLTTETFTVRFRMSINFSPAAYTFTIGGDDGVRLYVDGNLLINGYVNQPYTTYQGTIELDGQTELILEYYDNTFSNRVSFSYTSVPLPVTWYYFDGYHLNGANILEWQTASEINNVGFDVERSWDGKTFEKIGWVGGHGTSNQNHQYAFTDSSPRLGWSYYRLKQTDYDGKYEYSRLIPIYVDEIEEIQIYPNPLRDHIYLSRIDKNASVEVTITNVVAQWTHKLTQDPIQPARFSLNQRLTPGVYSVTIKMGDEVFQRKVIVE